MEIRPAHRLCLPVPLLRRGAAHGDPARRQGGHQQNGHDVAAVLRLHYVSHQPGHRLYSGPVHELRPQPSDLLLLQASGVCAQAVSHPAAGDHQGQRRAGTGDRVRPGADPLCLRRDGQPPQLCGAGGHDPRHERLLLHPLPDRLLPAAALHGRYGDEERDLPHRDGPHLCGVLRHDQRPYAHPDVRRDVHRLLCGVLHRGQHPGL